jgi:3-oxoacyl-[acyl-carrier-protein] synthase II
VAAARLAVEDAGLKFTPSLAQKTSVCFGNCVHGAGDLYETAHLSFVERGVAAVPPFTSLEFTAHAPTTHVSIEFGITGQAMTLASACSTGVDVVQWGHDRIAAGEATVVIAGSSEAPLFPYAFATLCALGVLTTRNQTPYRVPRPYDRDRDGMVLGEGGGTLILEDLDHALDRGAFIYAELLAFGNANESEHIRKVDLQGRALAEALLRALLSAQISPTEIDYINAHGNALADYDIAETNAFKKVFGPTAYNIPVGSIKSMIGQSLGVSGILQIASSCLTLTHGQLPPTINYETPDPACDLDYIPNVARRARVRKTLVNAHGMGGTHSVVILGQVNLN